MEKKKRKKKKGMYNIFYISINLFQGYYGCATGKARQAAKTEIEKLKVSIYLYNFLFKQYMI